MFNVPALSYAHTPTIARTFPAFTLAPGQLALLKGPNGSGKTTWLRLLATLLWPERSKKTILWKNAPLEDQAHEVVAYQGTKLAAPPFFTLEEALEHSRNAQLAIPPILQPLMHQPLHQLSQGQQRLASFYIAAQESKPLWLLDEPFTHLDDAAEALVAARIQQHLVAGGCVVLSAHEALQHLQPSLVLHLEGPMQRSAI